MNIIEKIENEMMPRFEDDKKGEKKSKKKSRKAGKDTGKKAGEKSVEIKEEASEERKETKGKPRTVNFEVGDTVRVHYRIVEAERERIQVFEGIVIAIDNKGISKTFSVRRISYDIGVERVFLVHSPRVSDIEIVRKGKIRRAKLYFLKDRTGKSAKLKQKRAKVKTAAESKDEITGEALKTDGETGKSESSDD